jgi:hypothetical protein
VLTPSNNAIPTAHWPVSVNFDHGVLPKTLELNAHRDQGGYRLKSTNLPAMTNTSYRGYGLVKPTVQTLALNQDIDHIPPQYDNDYSHNNTQTTIVNVPAGTARLIVENIKNVATTADVEWKRGWATIYIGLDSNNNGVPDFDDETLCVSNTELELNYCSISHPDAGNYWVFINNVRGGLSDGDPEIILDTYRIATAVVPESRRSRLADRRARQHDRRAGRSGRELEPAADGDGRRDLRRVRCRPCQRAGQRRLRAGQDHARTRRRQHDDEPDTRAAGRCHRRQRARARERHRCQPHLQPAGNAAGRTHRRAGLGQGQQRGPAAEPCRQRQYADDRRNAG